MCVIVVQLQDKPLPQEILENCWTNNNDGGGFAYIHRSSRKKVSVFKELKNFGLFYSNYKKAFSMKRKETPMVLHFRISTHGGVTEDNIHPHWVHENELALFHNGVLHLNNEGIYDKNLEKAMSDTALFAKFFLTKLDPNFFRDRALCFMIEKAIGAGNKLVTFNYDGEVTIFNESAGMWDKDLGCWFSNGSYKYRRTAVVTTVRSGGWSGHESYQRGHGHYYGESGFGSYASPNRSLPVSTTFKSPSTGVVNGSAVSMAKEDKTDLKGISAVRHRLNESKSPPETTWMNKSKLPCELCGNEVVFYKYRFLTRCCLACSQIIDNGLKADFEDTSKETEKIYVGT